MYVKKSNVFFILKLLSYAPQLFALVCEVVQEAADVAVLGVDQLPVIGSLCIEGHPWVLHNEVALDERPCCHQTTPFVAARLDLQSKLILLANYSVH